MNGTNQMIGFVCLSLLENLFCLVYDLTAIKELLLLDSLRDDGS
jgi:hypothetical protein